MICIYCFHVKTSVSNSRPHKKQPQNWRRRTCTACRKTFTTYERPSSDELRVRRPDGATEGFNIGKLLQSIARASQHNKKQAAYDSLPLASTVELALITNACDDFCVTPRQISEETHEVLKRFDELTAMQYAMQHGLIVSVRRRGRPSTTATTRADDAGRD